MFTKLYLDTTNPTRSLSDFLNPIIVFPMIVSIVFHTTIYLLFFNMVSWIFFESVLSYKINKRMITCLIPIMSLGFIGRFYHVKDVFQAYGNMEKTKNHLDNLYISWIFIS
jgi:hypothetical protein